MRKVSRKKSNETPRMTWKKTNEMETQAGRQEPRKQGSNSENITLELELVNGTPHCRITGTPKNISL